MIEGNNREIMATTMVTAASLITLGFVLFVGLKLRWFRARMRFDTNKASSSHSSVASASAPMTSVVGIYRPNKDESLAFNQLNSSATGLMTKPDHYRSMPNLSKGSRVDNNNTFTNHTFSADFAKSLNSLAAVSTSTKDDNANSTQQHNSLPSSSKPYSTISTNSTKNAINGEAPQTGDTDNKYKENRDIHSNRTADTVHSKASKKQKKRNKKDSIEKKDMDMGNLVFLDSQRSPINLSEYTAPEETPTRKAKGKAPIPPAPITKFHEYEEFDS